MNKHGSLWKNSTMVVFGCSCMHMKVIDVISTDLHLIHAYSALEFNVDTASTEVL